MSIDACPIWSVLHKYVNLNKVVQHHCNIISRATLSELLQWDCRRFQRSSGKKIEVVFVRWAEIRVGFCSIHRSTKGKSIALWNIRLSVHEWAKQWDVQFDRTFFNRLNIEFDILTPQLFNKTNLRKIYPNKIFYWWVCLNEFEDCFSPLCISFRKRSGKEWKITINYRFRVARMLQLLTFLEINYLKL